MLLTARTLVTVRVLVVWPPFETCLSTRISYLMCAVYMMYTCVRQPGWVIVTGYINMYAFNGSWRGSADSAFMHKLY